MSGKIQAGIMFYGTCFRSEQRNRKSSRNKLGREGHDPGEDPLALWSTALPNELLC